MPAPSLSNVPLTELDAVNDMLLSIGLAPVNTLSVSGLTDVSVARLVLHNTSREVQSRGWHFNTESDYPLTRDNNGKIVYPANVLSVDADDPRYDVVVRKDPADQTMRLYDRENHTFVFDKDLKVTIKLFLTFEELPAAARAYIAARAGRTFQARSVGSQVLYAFTKEREEETRAELEREELESADSNMFTGDPGTARIAYRERVSWTPLSFWR